MFMIFIEYIIALLMLLINLKVIPENIANIV